MPVFSKFFVTATRFVFVFRADGATMVQFGCSLDLAVIYADCTIIAPRGADGWQLLHGAAPDGALKCDVWGIPRSPRPSPARQMQRHGRAMWRTRSTAGSQ